MNRKRESELDTLRKEHQAATEENEKMISDLKKKHGESVKDYESQIETLQKAKNKYVFILYQLHHIVIVKIEWRKKGVLSHLIKMT